MVIKKVNHHTLPLKAINYSLSDMTKKLLTLSIYILAQLSFSAYGNNHKTSAECEKYKQDTEEHSRCLDGVKDTLERELQTWVNNHSLNLEEKSLVTGRYSALKMFKRSQSNFITFRDNNCRWQFLAIAPEKGAKTAYKTCYIRITQSRIQDLSAAK